MNLYKYMCDDCEHGFLIDDDYTDFCPRCGGLNLERIYNDDMSVVSELE